MINYPANWRMRKKMNHSLGFFFFFLPLWIIKGFHIGASRNAVKRRLEKDWMWSIHQVVASTVHHYGVERSSIHLMCSLHRLITMIDALLNACWLQFCWCRILHINFLIYSILLLKSRAEFDLLAIDIFWKSQCVKLLDIKHRLIKHFVIANLPLRAHQIRPSTAIPRNFMLITSSSRKIRLLLCIIHPSAQASISSRDSSASRQIFTPHLSLDFSCRH